MSKALLRRAEGKFKVADFKRADLVDRLYMYMIQPSTFEGVISFDEKDRLEKIKAAHALLLEFGSEYKVAGILRSRYPELKKHAGLAESLISDTKRLFGDIQGLNEQYERYIIKEKYYKVIEEAQAAEDFETVRKCLDSIAKLEGLNRPAEVAEEIPDLTIPPLVITTDPDVLKARNTENIEEAAANE